MTTFRPIRPAPRLGWRRAGLPLVVVLCVLAALLATASPAHAVLKWNSGNSVYTRIINCPSLIWGTPYDENGIGAFVSYYGDQASSPVTPATGQTTFMSTYVRLVGSHCSDPYIFPQFHLPAGVSFDKTLPIECYYTPPGDSNNPQQKITHAQQCPQWSNVAANGFYTSSYPGWSTGWPLPQHEDGRNGSGWEFVVPIKATTQQFGSELTTQLHLADGNGNEWIAPRVNFYTGPAPVTAPGAPTNVAANATSPTSARVSFNAPGNNGGSAITGYTARCESTTGGVTQTATGSSSPINVTGLSPSQTYACDVRATNGAGTGSWSNKSGSFTTPQVTTAPTKPTSVTITPLSPKSANVAFTPPASNGGSAITSYRAQCASTDGGTSRTVDGTSSPITFTNLSPGKAYRCRVKATNAVGSSSYSSYSSTVTMPAEAPGRPTNVTATAQSRTSAKVTFTPPAYDGGSPITSYRLQCVSSNGGTTRSADGVSSPTTVTRLTPGKAYRCRVRAINPAGASGYSAYTASFNLPA